MDGGLKCQSSPVDFDQSVDLSSLDSNMFNVAETEKLILF